MPVVNGCPLPDDLLYDVENQLWYRERSDGLVDVGMTAVAVAMVGGRIVAITPKRARRRVEAGQACAVIESGKFVGPAKVCFGAEIVESNEMLLDRPGVANTDPLRRRLAGRREAGRLARRPRSPDTRPGGRRTLPDEDGEDELCGLPAKRALIFAVARSRITTSPLTLPSPEGEGASGASG
jgi:glycine cleavage system H lipoate-binding protein